MPCGDNGVCRYRIAPEILALSTKEIGPWGCLVTLDYTCAKGHLGWNCRSPIPAHPVSRLVRFTLAIGTNAI
jgi:hypothetical protein